MESLQDKLGSIIDWFGAQWVWFLGLDDIALQIGVVSGVLAIIGALGAILTFPARAARKRREREAREQRKAETERRETEARARAEQAQAERDEMQSKMEAQSADLDEVKTLLKQMTAQQSDLAPETSEAFGKAVDDIAAGGDMLEKEALSLLAEGKTDEAAARYESDLRQAAGQAIEKLRRKGALFAPFDTHIAKEAYERLLALAPNDLDARNELGTLLMRLGELAAAEAAYQAVFDGADGDKTAQAAALGNLGIIAQTRGDLDAAEDYLKRSLEIDETLGRKEGMANQLGKFRPDRNKTRRPRRG